MEKRVEKNENGKYSFSDLIADISDWQAHFYHGVFGEEMEEYRAGMNYPTSHFPLEYIEKAGRDPSTSLRMTAFPS